MARIALIGDLHGSFDALDVAAANVQQPGDAVGQRDDRRAVAEAAGLMSEAAQTRAERALSARRAPDDIDIPEAEAQLETLMTQA